MKRYLGWFGLFSIFVLAGSLLANDWDQYQNTATRFTDKEARTVCEFDFDVTSLPYSHNGSLAGAGNDCGIRASEEHIYRLNIRQSGSYTISLCGTTAGTDTYIYLMDECCGGNEITRNDDGCGAANGPSRLTCVTLDQGVYYLLIEASTPQSVGPYSLEIEECSNPCDDAQLTDGTYPSRTIGLMYVQTVDSNSSSPAYEGPFYTPNHCTNGASNYGFDFLSWNDNDFGWLHSWPDFAMNGGVCVDSAFLQICAWDVDFSDCLLQNNGDTSACERDLLWIDNEMLEPVYLTGTSESWSVTTFAIPVELLADGLVDVWMDIDEGRFSCSYATIVHRSQLIVYYRAEPCNHPPFTPEGTANGCIEDDTDMCVTVTGPTPADPDGDLVHHEYMWYVSNAATSFAWAYQSSFTLPCLPAAASSIGDAWKVDVTAIDALGNRSDTVWTTTFNVVPDCGNNPVVGWDLGDLDPDLYHITGTALAGGPANPISQNNVAWLGMQVTSENTPNVVDEDFGDDGVEFLNAPWMPCEEVCVNVLISTGPGYVVNTPLYLYAWKDGNIDNDFLDRACTPAASECLINGAAITGLIPSDTTTLNFCFIDPGILDSGRYDGKFRFRLLSEQPGPVAALTSIDPLLGETEDYVIGDLQLAVELQSFEAAPSGDAILLSWTTASEHLNDHFKIERRSGDGWTRIADRIEGAGNSSGSRSYSFRDPGVENGRIYEYRLIAVDFTGAQIVLAKVETAMVETDPAFVDEFQLYPNYPNPFNPATTIAFDLKESGMVTLTVFDVTGREVAALTNGYLAAGRHRVVFEAGNLPSGLYLYRLTTPGYTALQKMILLK